MRPRPAIDRPVLVIPSANDRHSKRQRFRIPRANRRHSGRSEESPSSGTPIKGDPGNDAFGLLKQGTLEEANVNIAEELVGLIIAQRAFEANTRVISAADDMLRFVTQR